MNAILRIKIKQIYIRQSLGAVLINISERKKKKNYTNIEVPAKTRFGHSIFYKNL